MNDKRIFLIVIAVLFCSCSHFSSNKMDKEQVRIDLNFKLNNLLSSNSVDSASLYVDSLISLFPDEPTYFFVKGWIEERMGDSLQMRNCFVKCRSLYDIRLLEKQNWSDALNRAVITQILYGISAYHKELDSLKTLKNEEYDYYLRDSTWYRLDYEKIKDGIFHPVQKL